MTPPLVLDVDPTALGAFLDRLCAAAGDPNPAAQGAGVRVAVVDTGVDRTLLVDRCHARGAPPPRMLEGGIFESDRASPLPYQGRQSAPHGTQVADILLRGAPSIELFSADIFGPRGVSDLESLIHAIDYARTHWQVQVINISVGITEAQLQTLARREALRRAIDACYHAGILVVAAAHQDHPTTRSYPALFGSALVAVQGDAAAVARGWRYAPNTEIEFVTRGLTPGTEATAASSWAAPYLAAIAARWLGICPDLRPFEIKTLLRRLATRDGIDQPTPSSAKG